MADLAKIRKDAHEAKKLEDEVCLQFSASLEVVRAVRSMLTRWNDS